MSTRFAKAEPFGRIEAVRSAYPAAVEVDEIEGGWKVFASEDEFARGATTVSVTVAKKAARPHGGFVVPTRITRHIREP